MNYSPALRKEMKRYGIDVKEYAYAVLVASGWSRNDAYMQSHGESITVSEDWVGKQVKRLDSKSGVKECILDLNGGGKDNDDRELMKGLSKEETLKELLLAKKNFEAGSKEWLDINKQIIEVTQMKKDEVKDEESLIHFYLPLSCNVCPLYMKAQKKNVE